MDITFVILSFEGPDLYSRAGGLATRVAELSEALADMGFQTHLFFIGDPNLPGHEITHQGRLHLHRWCQWISKHHMWGVYDGEEGKLNDWNRSLPPWLEKEVIAPAIDRGGYVVVMGEEWQTTSALITLRQTITRRGWHGKVHLLWNANNVFSFERIDWRALKDGAMITTVSRYMKHLMWPLGFDARVVPNGIPERWLIPVPQEMSQPLLDLFKGRMALVKVARWDPDKRWDMAVDAVLELRRRGYRPLFLARGGMEAHGKEVIVRAEKAGLRVTFADWKGSGVPPMVEAIRNGIDGDMLVLLNFLSEEQRRVLYHAGDAVLANSGREPFGLVGLETMAVGGVAMVGSTGEDYVTPGHDAISLQTADPLEIVNQLTYLLAPGGPAPRLRIEARRSAARYTWPAVVRRVFLPMLQELGVPVAAMSGNGVGTSAPPNER